MSNEPTYTIDIVPVGDHLQVAIPELGITIETAPGKIKRDDATDAALSAISEYHMRQQGRSQVKAS